MSPLWRRVRTFLEARGRGARHAGATGLVARRDGVDPPWLRGYRYGGTSSSCRGVALDLSGPWMTGNAPPQCERLSLGGSAPLHDCAARFGVDVGDWGRSPLPRSCPAGQRATLQRSGPEPWRTEVGTPEIGWGAGEVPPRPRTTAATHARYCRARAIRKFECRQTLAVLQRNCASSHANIDPACVGLLQVERSPPQNQVRGESGNSSPGVPCTAGGEE